MCVSGLAVAGVHSNTPACGPAAKVSAETSYVKRYVRHTEPGGGGRQISIRGSGQRREVGLEALTVGIRKIQSQRHVLCAGRGRQTKADLLDQRPVRRRSHAQLPRELRRVGERQLRSNSGLVTADTQLQGRRTRNARGGRRVGERTRRRGAAGAPERRCWIRRDHTLRAVLCRGERGAATSLQVTAIAIAIGRGPVQALIPQGGVTRGNLRQQSLAQ